MVNKVYDVAILGGGVSGAFAAYKLSKYKDIKACIIDFGRPPGKRRKQLQGWFGCFPYSNARLYTSDWKKVANFSGKRATLKANRFVNMVLEEHGPINAIKNKHPDKNIINKLNNSGYNLDINDYYQWKPENIHSLSRYIANKISDKVDFYFDNNIDDIDKNKLFEIKTEKGKILAKNIIFAVGRSGWRFARDIYSKFDMIQSNDDAYFGFMGEIYTGSMKGWNKSHCTIYNDNFIIGPLSWNGTVIPEDHYDLVISSWRSNEDRWRSDKVSFSVIKKVEFKNFGVEQSERLGKLAYILSDNRVGRNKVKDYISHSYDISLIPEYSWFKEFMKEVDEIVPNFVKKGYFYIPNILTFTPKIKINKDLSTNVEGMFVAGESAGMNGILAAAISGCISADNLI
jgi:thioredoxin reductase